MSLLADFIDEFGGPGTPLTVAVIPLGAAFRINEAGKPEFLNPDDDKWHEVRPRGETDETQEWEIRDGAAE